MILLFDEPDASLVAARPIGPLPDAVVDMVLARHARDAAGTTGHIT